jgi:hypothetical protein
MCVHVPSCPPAADPGHRAARILVSYPEQGWSLLCNGVVVFDDDGELLPDGRALEPSRPVAARRGAGSSCLVGAGRD